MSSQNCCTKNRTKHDQFWVPFGTINLSHSHVKASHTTLSTLTFVPVNWSASTNTYPKLAQCRISWSLSHKPNWGQSMVVLLRPAKAGWQSLSCTSGDRADRRLLGRRFVGVCQKEKLREICAFRGMEAVNLPWLIAGNDANMAKKNQRAKCLSYYPVITWQHIICLWYSMTSWGEALCSTKCFATKTTQRTNLHLLNDERLHRVVADPGHEENPLKPSHTSIMPAISQTTKPTKRASPAKQAPNSPPKVVTTISLCAKKNTGF